MFDQKTVTYGSTYIFIGRYISLIEIQCSIPIEALLEHKYTTYIVKGYTAAIGYTNIYFSSQALQFYGYDSKCQIPQGTEEVRHFKIAVSIRSFRFQLFVISFFVQLEMNSYIICISI